jgi:hypothetical protein
MEVQEIPEVDRLVSLYERLKIATATLADAVLWPNFQFNAADNGTDSNSNLLDELEDLGREIVNILPQTGRLLMVGKWRFLI